MGIPTTPVVTRAFKDLALSTAAKRGMPRQRITFTPHPIWGRTAEEIWGYLGKNDPVSEKPIMMEMVDYLSKPLAAEEMKSGIVTPSVGPPTFGPDTADNLQQYYHDNGMSDYLPIILPTEEKVDAMLKGTSHPPDQFVGKMAGGLYDPWSYNARQVAINAVMAGAKPEYFPVILAIAASGVSALGSSTTSFAYSMVINGPIRDKLTMNYAVGAMGPFAQPNATIGRAWTILSKNLGNAGIPGDTYLGSQGNNLNYNNIVIAENETDSPWTPFHVQKGFRADESVVSLFAGEDLRQGHGAKHAGVLENPMFDEQISDIFGTLIGIFGALVICDPLVAKRLVEQGYDTKEKITDWLWKNTTLSVKDYKVEAFVYQFDYPRAIKGTEPWATWYKLPDDAVIPRWPKPEHINLVVTGGQTNAFFQVGNLSYRASVSIDQWA